MFTVRIKFITFIYLSGHPHWLFASDSDLQYYRIQIYLSGTKPIDLLVPRIGDNFIRLYIFKAVFDTLGPFLSVNDVCVSTL